MSLTLSCNPAYFCHHFFSLYVVVVIEVVADFHHHNKEKKSVFHLFLAVFFFQDVMSWSFSTSPFLKKSLVVIVNS